MRLRLRSDADLAIIVAVASSRSLFCSHTAAGSHSHVKVALRSYSASGSAVITTQPKLNGCWLRPLITTGWIEW